jgi:DNA repair protein RecN (Recombination protein N)
VAALRLDPGSTALARVEEVGGQVDEDGCVVALRTVEAAGRSRAVLGGVGVPAGALAEVVGSLVEVHGQHAQQRLLRPAEQRRLLDRFAGAELLAMVADYGQAWSRWRAIRARIGVVQDRAVERAREIDLLGHGLQRIEHLAPQRGEDAGLRGLTDRLTHAEALRAAVEDAIARLSADGDDGQVGVTSQLSLVARVLSGAAEHDLSLQGPASRARDLQILAAELVVDLAGAAEGYDVEPGVLDAALERRAALAGLSRLYGAQPCEDPTGGPADALLAWAEQAAARLAELTTADQSVDALMEQEQRLGGELAVLAGRVRDARSAAAGRLSDAVTHELQGLGMLGARVTAQLLELGQGDEVLELHGRAVPAGPHGVDDVAILLSAAPDAPLRPLARGASGGELSRVMLAIEVVFAQADDMAMLVFDEVDAGVGGRAAVEVGRRLARLARDHQVVVVTHLPQVAAYADEHLVVVKDARGEVTRSGVRRVTGEDRLVELARMLAGDQDSRSAREHAQELLARAEQERSTPV